MHVLALTWRRLQRGSKFGAEGDRFLDAPRSLERQAERPSVGDHTLFDKRHAVGENFWMRLFPPIEPSMGSYSNLGVVQVAQSRVPTSRGSSKRPRNGSDEHRAAPARF